MASTSTHRTKVSRSRHAGPGQAHPHSVPILAADEEAGQTPDQPFAEGAYDAVDPDLRHRLISEAAYHRYVERGYADGYDFEDWLQAESDIEHLLLNPSALEASPLQGRQAESKDMRETGGQEASPRSIAHDEAMKRIIKQHPQRDIPRVESLEAKEAPSKE